MLDLWIVEEIEREERERQEKESQPRIQLPVPNQDDMHMPMTKESGSLESDRGIAIIKIG